MTNKVNRRAAVFALAFSGVLASTAFAAEVSNETEYVADITNAATTTTTVTAPIAFTGAIPAATPATGFSLVGAAGLTQPALDGAAATGRALAIGTPVLLIKNLEFTGFTAAGTDSGAAVAAMGNVARLEDLRFSNNTAAGGSGGAIVVDAALTGGISGSTFEDNEAGQNAGALGVNGDLTGGIANSTFKANKAGDNGGAVGVFGDFEGNLTGSTFEANEAGSSGGALVVLGGFTGDIDDSIFKDNRSAANAGAVAVVGDFTGDVRASTFEGNTAGTQAGALAVNGHFTGSIVDSVFADNTSGNSGGAVAIGGDFTGDISGATFSGNTAGASGGALALGGNFTGNITGSIFENNVATNGAALNYDGDFKGAIQGSRFVGNKVTNHGGAINAATQQRQSPEISGSTFIGNEAGGAANLARGGALAINGSTKLTDNTFLKNRATTTTTDLRNGAGGAIHHNTRADGTTLTIESTAGNRTLFYGNTHGPAGSAEVENALYFANRGPNTDRRTMTLDIAGGGDLLLLDGLLQSRITAGPGRARVTVNVSKATASTGTWYLGGRSELRDESTWAIDGGSLILTDVDYGSGVVAADLRFSGEVGTLNLGADATLGGSGTIHAVTDGLALNGTLDPATWSNVGTLASDITNAISAADIAAIGVAQTSEIGSLTLEGDTTLGANTVYNVDARADGTGADSITIIGTGNIDPNASVALTLAPGTWNGPVGYTILSADGGLGGTEFAALAADTGYLFLNATLSYPNANDVRLNLTRNGNFATVGTTANQVATGVAINGLADTHPVIIALMGTTAAADALNAFDSLSGEIYSSTGTALLQNSSHIRDLIGARFFESEATGRQRGVWGTVYGYTGELKGNSNTAKAESDSFGFAVGGDLPIPFGDSGNVGLLLGYETTDVELGGGRASKSEVDTFNIGTYLGTSFNGFEIRSGLAYSRHDIDTTRDIQAGTLSGRNVSDSKASLTQVFGEVAYPVSVAASLQVSPYAGLQGLWLSMDGARETGTEAALRTDDWSADVMLANVGLRFKTADLSQSDTSKVFLHGDLGWRHAFDEEDGRHRRRFESATATSSDFSVRGARLDEDRFVLGLGLSAEIAANQSLALDYQGEFSSRQNQHGGKLHWSLKF